ncbi:SR-related and CTD-associated factor 4-like [Bactrocera tryoni]|uniref:SR-related and CTD-associated factor 4-like n=1 Tax=Bactrocera tryoni TaxID=59916 RepID=UPI001A96A69C|nr:SR-related and CTD-associated factor 4-like [Bactrocera tryoni]
MKQFLNINSSVVNGCSSKGKTIHEQCSPKDKMVEQVKDTLLDQHLGYPVQKVVDLNDPPTTSNNVKRVRATTAIPPSSMAAIQQSMVYANAIPISPPSLTPPNSPFDQRYGDYTMDRRLLYAQPPYVPAYPPNYRPTSQYTIPMMNMLHAQRQVLIPAQPGIAQPGFMLPYTALPTNSTAGQYYHTNVAQPWSNVTTSAPPSPTRAHQPKECAGMPRSKSFPDSTTMNALVTQANKVNKTFYPEVQVVSTTPQYYNEPKNQAKVTENPRPQQAVQPTIFTKPSSPAPTATKPLLPEATPSSGNSTKRKSIEYLAEKLTASEKKIKMMSSAFKLEHILKYRPNMVRHRPKKEESAEQRLARERNTIACRKYRRMRRIAKILEQEMGEAESVNHIMDVL